MRQTDIDKAPYFDDHNPLKRFHQVLFKAGTTVQSRELNELQDILQGQVEAIGSHLFKNGSVVIPGNFVTQTKLISIALGGIDSEMLTTLKQTKDVYVRGLTSQVEAKVTMFASVSSVVYAFCEVTKSGPNGVTKTFTGGEAVLLYTISTQDDETTITNSSVLTIGVGSFSTVNEGIYYVRGMMVRCETQTIILSPNQNVSTRVGFKVGEEIITANQDDDLYSNALNYPNYRAVGADRLKLTLTLETRDLDVEDANFLELAKVVDGNVESLLSQVQYNELEKVLAQRTFEQSGNYSVTPSTVELREHLQVDDNGGVYPLEDGGDDSKLVAVVSPSIHYVLGYRIENSTPRLVELNKSRDTDVANNSVTASIFGNCIEVNSATGTPIVDFNTLYSLRDISDAVIGTFRAATVQRLSPNTFRFIARNIQFNPGKSWANAVAIRASKGSASFRGVLTTKGVTLGGLSTLILPLPYGGVRSLESAGGSDTTYSVTSDFSVVLNSSGVGTVVAPSGSVFTGQFSQFSVSTLSGTVAELTATYGLTGTPIGSSLQVDVGSGYANQTVKLMAIYQKVTSGPKTKTRTRVTQTVAVNGSAQSFALPNCDGIKLVNVTISGEDYTNLFEFDGGQRDNTYELSTIKPLSSLPTATAIVEYEFFAHGPGDYFCVDSYADEEYKDIPSYTTSTGIKFDMRDCLDFRKSILVGGSSYMEGSVSSQYSSIQADVEYYLPRFSSLYVTSEGTFAIANGISSQNPEIPLVPENSMRLVDFFLPSWTPDIESVLRFPVNNRRYTMRDIGKLETRIENVEYYTSLSQLEASSNNIQVIDPSTGNDRFKNGIFADPMTDFRLFNPEDEESFASIDDINGRLRPLVDSIGVNMVRVSGGLVRDDMISSTVASDIMFDSQPFATRTINVNPYAVFSWAGFVTLSPSRDFWVDTVYAPNKVINQTENHRGATKEGVVYGKWNSLNGGVMAFRFNQQRQVTTTSFTEWTTSSTSETTLKTELIPFMRTIDITFRASGLRPFTRVYPWFANRNVSANCRPIAGTLGQALTTDATGAVTGVFTVPNTSAIRFSTGVSSFILVDNANSPNNSLDRTTLASATFESGGKLVTKQKTTVQTRHLGSTTRTELEYRKVDPIAQSFSVDQVGGLMLKGVDLYFSTKAKSIPVTVEIRGMENGLPTHEVLARSVLQPSEVLTSISGTTPTRFEFQPFCYLAEGSEYAVVVLANTQEYEVYIAQMGQRVINSTESVAVQPHTGVFFTSSNGSTWSAQQTQDMKFRLVRANFNTASEQVLFRPSIGAQGRFLPSNPLSVVASSNIMTIEFPFHGCKAGDQLTLSGIVPDYGLETAVLNATHTVIEVVNFKTVRVQLSASATTTGQFGGSVVFGTARNNINLVNINIDHSVYEGTSCKFEMRYRQASNRVMGQWIEFTPGTDILLSTEGSFRDTTDLEVRATLTSTSFLSPQIDIHGFTAVLNAFYLSDSEDLMAYVSRDIYLDNPSTSGKIFVTSMLTTGSSIKLYVKYINDTESDWVELSSANPIVPGTNSFTENQFDIGEVAEFIGVRVKLVVRGPRTNPPVIRDIRGVLLA